jgi:hypothetical protein
MGLLALLGRDSMQRVVFGFYASSPINGTPARNILDKRDAGEKRL